MGRIIFILCLPIFLITSLHAGDEKKADNPESRYDELFSFPPKITLDENQKEKLAGLRKELEPRIAQLDKALKLPATDGNWLSSLAQSREKLEREILRKKNAVLTQEQKEILGIKIVVPSFAQEMAIGDEKIWDLSQLEKNFTIESRNFDPDEQVLSLVVITKRKWTDQERQIDASNWGGGTYYESPIQVVFYNKNEEKSFMLTGPYAERTRGSSKGDGGITRVPIKLTDKQVEEGLVRYRIKLDLDKTGARGMDAASAKFICPELK